MTAAAPGPRAWTTACGYVADLAPARPCRRHGGIGLERHEVGQREPCRVVLPGTEHAQRALQRRLDVEPGHGTQGGHRGRRQLAPARAVELGRRQRRACWAANPERTLRRRRSACRYSIDQSVARFMATAIRPSRRLGPERLSSRHSSTAHSLNISEVAAIAWRNWAAASGVLQDHTQRRIAGTMCESMRHAGTSAPNMVALADVGMAIAQLGGHGLDGAQAPGLGQEVCTCRVDGFGGGSGLQQLRQQCQFQCGRFRDVDAATEQHDQRRMAQAARRERVRRGGAAGLEREPMQCFHPGRDCGLPVDGAVGHRWRLGRQTFGKAEKLGCLVELHGGVLLTTQACMPAETVCDGMQPGGHEGNQPRRRGAVTLGVGQRTHSVSPSRAGAGHGRRPRFRASAPGFGPASIGTRVATQVASCHRV
jgi:hypothetical protein